MAGWFNKSDDELDYAIEKLVDELETYNSGDPEYQQALDNLDRLHRMRNAEPRRAPISWDTVATVAAYLGGIVIVVGYEHKNVITSKALSLLPKPKMP